MLCSNPKISVVMTCRNFDFYFERSLDSIVAQSYQDYEIILVVESDYEIFEYIINSKFSQYKHKIKLLLVRVKGFCFCINYAINEASGKYIARMDSDDISMPERFKFQVDFLENNPEYSIVGSRAMAIDAHDRVIDNVKLKFYQSHSSIVSALFYRNPLYHSSLMIRGELFLKKGGYKYDFFAQDHEMWIRWSFDKDIKFFNLNKVLYLYRRYDGQETNIANSKRAYYEISSFLYKFFLQTKNPKYLLGILVVHPVARAVLQKIKKFKNIRIEGQ